MNTSSVVDASYDDSYYDNDGGGGRSIPSCRMPMYNICLITLAIAMSMMIVTFIWIPCHRRLRKQHHIFPYNLVLSDLSGAIALVCFEAYPNVKQLEEAYIILDIFLVTSIMVSLLSIALVTGYQFITIRVDPFGSRNIITTPRMIMTCIVTWALGFTCSSSIIVVFIDEDDQLFIALLSLSWSTTIATGLCYFSIYRSVARVPCDGSITQERKEENQRILRTYGLIFGTTVLCWICPWVFWTRKSLGYTEICLGYLSDTMITINWIANSIIYWWRLKEFRLIFGLCRKQRIDPLL